MHRITTHRSRWALLLLLVAPAARAQGNLDESTGVETVCSAGPGAALARATRLRGAASVAAASVLPNPELAVEHDQILTGDGGHETTVGVGVPIVINGRRTLLRDAASARTRAARAEAEETLFEQSLGFREAYSRAVVQRERSQVLGDQQRELESLAETIQALSKGGEVAGYDLMRQRNRARVHRRQLESAQASEAAAVRMLEAWTGQAAAGVQGSLTELAGGSALLARARSTRAAVHPKVRSLRAHARAAALEAKAARRRSVPDLGLFVGYRTVTTSAGGASETGHGFRLGLSVPLPLFDYGQADAARAGAEESIAIAAADQVTREQSARSRAALDRLERLERGVPDMELAVREASELGVKARRLYAAGELSITDLLDAYRSAEEARLARVDLAEEIAEARLSLMRASGTQFDARLDAVCGRQP